MKRLREINLTQPTCAVVSSVPMTADWPMLAWSTQAGSEAPLRVPRAPAAATCGLAPMPRGDVFHGGPAQQAKQAQQGELAGRGPPARLPPTTHLPPA